jgi:hypothetical protein
MAAWSVLDCLVIIAPREIKCDANVVSCWKLSQNSHGYIFHVLLDTVKNFV